MDSRTALPHGHGYGHDPHNISLHPVAEGEDEQQHDKKSVLKKVKAKAKKIKDTIKKHGHGHDHEHDHDYHSHDLHLDEEDDEHEETVEDPDVHGATTIPAAFGSAAVKSAIPGQLEDSGQAGVSAGRFAETRGDLRSSEGRHDAEVRGLNTAVSRPFGVNETKVSTDPTKAFVPGEGENTGRRTVNLGRPMELEEDPHAPKDRSQAYASSNYQTKETDPTGAGGEEAEITPILGSFDKINVYDKPDTRTAEANGDLPATNRNQFTNLVTGSHNQFSPEPVPPEAKAIRDKSQLPESFDTPKPETYPQEISGKPSNESSYAQKISSATSAIADKAVSTKNAIASKLGYGEKDETAEKGVHEGDHAKSAVPVEIGKKIAATVTEKLTPVYEKVAEAGSTVMSKVHGSDTGTGNESEGGFKGQDKVVSAKDYVLEKLRPGDEDRALSGKISDALHRGREETEKANTRPVGKVNESEEVARRLGTKDENYGERVQSSYNGQGTGVVNKLKDVVGSWFGSGGGAQSQVSEEPHGNEGISSSVERGVGSGSHAAEGRRLQEN